MNLNTSGFVVFFFYACTAASGQEFSLRWGSEIEASRKTAFNNIVGKDSSGIYVEARFQRGTTVLTHLDRNFNLKNSYEFDFTGDDEKNRVHGVLLIKGKLYVLFSSRDQKKIKTTLYVDEVNKQNLHLKNQKRRLVEVDNIGDTDHFSFFVSRDTSKVLILYSSKKDIDSRINGLFVFDADLIPIWKKPVDIPFTPRAYGIESARVDNQGNAYLLVSAGTWKYFGDEIFSYSNNGDSLKRYPIKIEILGRSVADADFDIVNNTIICAGFYAQRREHMEGVFCITIDIGTKIIKSQSHKEVSIEFVPPKKYDQWGIAIFTDIYIQKDGSVLLVGEQHNVVKILDKQKSKYRYISDPNIKVSKRFNYNDIIVSKINQQGEFEFVEKVHKVQETSDERAFYFSFLPVSIENKIGVIFNDNIKNVDYSGAGQPKTYFSNNSVAMMVTFDAKGNQIRKPIPNSLGVDIIIRPRECKQLSANEVVLFGQKGKTQQFGKLQFKP